jgi:alpha/beta hydrolase family protein
VKRVRASATFACALALSLPAAAGATPVPKVTGPLPVSATSYPFGAADHQQVPQDLHKIGYVEDEYLASGKANVYSWPAPGPAVVRTPDAPYTTRVLVRRPANASRFSGNVIVEILNPSNAFDLNIGWALAQRQIVADGDAWVGVTGKPISIDALKNFDPVRYGSLSMANPLPLNDPRNCNPPVSFITPASRATEDGLVYDITSQIGAWVRSRDRSNPLTYGKRHGSPVDRVYDFGYSQTGSFEYDYINAIQPLVKQSDGRPMFDGYIVAVAGGGFIGAAPINQCEPAPPNGDPRKQFKDAGTPIIHMMSQSDYLIGIGARRPDSDARQDRYRHYEMAGAAHATPDELFYSAAAADIVKAGRVVPPGSCNEGPRSRFPSSIFFDAALRNLDWWVRLGIAPPHADPILVSGSPPAPVLDEFGNVQGGLRSPYLDVPTSTWFGSSTGPSFCGIAGHEVPFGEAQLSELYRNHGDYVRKVTRDTARLVADRFLTVRDGLRLIQEAARANVP